MKGGSRPDLEVGNDAERRGAIECLLRAFVRDRRAERRVAVHRRGRRCDEAAAALQRDRCEIQRTRRRQIGHRPDRSVGRAAGRPRFAAAEIVRAHVGVVSQDIVLFDDSVGGNNQNRRQQSDGDEDAPPFVREGRHAN